MDINFYQQIKNYYNDGLYTEEDLDTFVKANMLTEEQKDEIIKTKNTTN